MKRWMMAVAAGACLLVNSGCTALVGTYHTQHDMSTAARAENAGFTLKGFDPEVGGPSISADLGQIVANLYANHMPSMAVANGLDAVGLYLIGKNQKWWGSDGGGDAKQTAIEYPSGNTGRDLILIQGNDNKLDTSSGHNTSDNHSQPALSGALNVWTP